jgi:hypothetical protein
MQGKSGFECQSTPLLVRSSGEKTVRTFAFIAQLLVCGIDISEQPKTASAKEGNEITARSQTQAKAPPNQGRIA